MQYACVQGEEQKKLDVLADDVFVNVLTRCGQCAVLVLLSSLPTGLWADSECKTCMDAHTAHFNVIQWYTGYGDHQL